MPLYEYQCQKCEQRIEVLQKFADDPLTTCENCGGELKKLLSAPAVQFKGTGWYVTDYAGKKSDSGSKKSSDKKSDGDGAKSSGGSGDSGSSKPKSSSSDSGSKPAS